VDVQNDGIDMLLGGLERLNQLILDLFNIRRPGKFVEASVYFL
jgi:hypothetical protein